MKPVIYKSPEELRQLVRSNQKESAKFIRQLKKRKPTGLDELVHELHHEAFSRFNCLDCANCCKTIGPLLIPSDVDRLARHLKMKYQEFMEKYVVTDEDGDLVFRQHPCPFLQDDNYCMVYEQRPRACREYPHTDRSRFHQILDLTLKNCETCPVVYEIVEELKKPEHKI
jgi:hypothetical protein